MGLILLVMKSYFNHEFSSDNVAKTLEELKSTAYLGYMLPFQIDDDVTLTIHLSLTLPPTAIVK